MKAPLSKIAHTRSGDKGDTANIGVIAWRPDDYPVLLRQLTAERVKAYNPRLVGMIVFGHQPSASTQMMVGAALECRARVLAAKLIGAWASG